MSASSLAAELDGRRIVLRHISEIVAERREPRWLFPKYLEKGVLAVMAGQRSTFKSFIALDWMMRVAVQGHPVVLLSGEGAGLDRRVDAWVKTYGDDLDLPTLPICALERPLNLNLAEEVGALVAAIQSSRTKPDAILIDTLSKFSAGLDEQSNSHVAEFLSRLSRELRERFDCTVLLVAHAGHSDAKRPRGASALMANPDAEYIVERANQQAMVATVTRERFKDYQALPPVAYAAEPVDLGRLDAHGEPVTSLIMRATDAPAVVRSRGKHQETALSALREWSRNNPDRVNISSLDVRLLLKAQGVPRQRNDDVISYLVRCGVLTAAAEGFTIDPAGL
jgi:hypothetical protein